MENCSYLEFEKETPFIHFAIAYTLIDINSTYFDNNLK